MAKLVCIGEIIADSILSSQNNQINIGGAPLNVCIQVHKLEGESIYLSKVGAGAYSKNLLSSLDEYNFDKSYIINDKKCNTTIAYIKVNELGDRSFTFLKNNPGELNLDFKDYQKIVFEKGDIFEFGSVALQSAKSMKAHDKLIKKAKEQGALIAFDPNLRRGLWNNDEKLKNTVLKYIKKVDILKVSDDELQFLFQNTEREAIKKLIAMKVKIILVTRGKKGASVYLESGDFFDHKGYSVETVDTTGCGDSFFGAFLYKILEKGDDINFKDALDFANKCGAFTSKNYGAIKAMPTKEEIDKTNFLLN